MIGSKIKRVIALPTNIEIEVGLTVDELAEIYSNLFVDEQAFFLNQIALKHGNKNQSPCWYTHMHVRLWDETKAWLKNLAKGNK